MLSGKKLLLFGFVVVLLVVIPLTVYLVKQQQKLGVGAAPNTSLSFIPATLNKNINDQFILTVSLNPGSSGGTNEVSFIKLTINFDPAKLTPTAMGPDCTSHPDYVFCPDPTLFPGTPLVPPKVNTNNITVTLSVGSDPTKAIKTIQNIGTVKFTAKDAASPTVVSFASAPDTQVLSVANADQFNENVLLSTTSSSITIAQATAAQTPVCTALNLDKQPTGTAPYTINFTAIGSETGGKITQVTFNWGDGPSQSVTDTGTNGGGVGTSKVQTQLIHTYNNPGTFTASATLTDSNGNVSPIGPCTQAVSIAAASSPNGATGGTIVAGGPGTTTQVATVSASPTPTPTPTPMPTPIPHTTKGGLAETGPGDSIVSLGGAGVGSIILGLVLLFGL